MKSEESPPGGRKAAHPAKDAPHEEGAPAALREAAGGGKPSWKLHDFRKPRPLAEHQLHALDTLHCKFARSLSDALSVLIRSRVQVDLTSVSQFPYFDFIRSLPNPTSLHLVQGHPHKAPLVLEMSLDIIFVMIEKLLGGKGDGLQQPRRPLTRIEQQLVQTLVKKILDVLSQEWSQDPEFRLDLVEAEHNPLLMQVVGPAEATVVLAFEISLGLRSGSLHLALPLKPFEPLIARLIRAATPGAGPDRNSEQERDAILRRLAAGDVTLSAELGAIPLRLKDLLTLRPGDMIDTQIENGSEVLLLVEKHPIFRAVAASREGRRVLKITRLDGS